jgi:hypothetical protein
MLALEIAVFGSDHSIGHNRYRACRSRQPTASDSSLDVSMFGVAVGLE